MSDADGVLVVDKPTGPTSHDIVARVRRFFRGRRVGHTGTLDPLATGVLPLCVGRATRLARFLTASRKTYRGAMRLGVATDTYDSEGAMSGQVSTEGLDIDRLRRAAEEFTGEIDQLPPPYSARKVAGRPLYKLARQGVEVTLQAKRVTVHRFEILRLDGDLAWFEAATSPGTYVRSLAHDLGRSLECGAHLVELQRTESGGFRIDQSRSMEEIENLGRQGRLSELLLPLSRLDLGLPSVTVTGEGLAAMRTGRALSDSEILPGPG